MCVECKFWILSKSQFQKSRKAAHRCGGFRAWGQNPIRQPGIRPQIIWAHPLTIYAGKNFDPQKPEVGDLLGWFQYLWPPSFAPNGGRGSGVMPVNRSRRVERLQKFSQKSQFRVSRKFDFSLFPLGRHCGEQVKKNGHRYDSDNKVLNKTESSRVRPVYKLWSL